MTIQPERAKKCHFFPFLTSILPPSVFLLYFYQQNVFYLSFGHVFVAIVIFAICAVGLHLVVSKLTQSSEAAALINNVLWIIFFTVKAPYRFFLNFADNEIYILVPFAGIVMMVAITIIYLTIKQKTKLKKQEIFKILAIFWLAIFMVNAASAIQYSISNSSKLAGYDENDHKTDFNVDANLPSPNIYWLFMDGMLGFKAMERFFDDTQPELSAQLTERGFIINREARFEALQRTAHCIPALMCPHYYDTFFAPRLLNWDLYDYKKIEGFRRNIKIKADLACFNNELISAFGKKGYQTNAIAQSTYQYFQQTDVKYMNGKKIDCGEVAPDILTNIEKLRCGKILFNHVTLMGKLNFILDRLFDKYENNKLKMSDIQNYHCQSSDDFKSFFGESYQGDDRWYLNALADIMNHATDPTLTIIHDSKPHWPFVYDKQGNTIKRREKESMDFYNYPFQHHFTASIVISYIDFILNADPNSIIILQSDHGLHSDESRALFIAKYGNNSDEMRLMQNQTISAVRIPDIGNEQPIDPLNITRVLVNRFVGDNYQLLDTKDVIK